MIKVMSSRAFKELIYDDSFGMLTRNGLKRMIKRNRKPFDVIFIDIRDVSGLNSKYGYSKVNDMIKELFGTFEFRNNDIVARWFSGDEIAIVTGGGEGVGLLERFQKYSFSKGIRFTSKVFKNYTKLPNI